MAKVFRSLDVDQSWPLPPSPYVFVPPGHMAHFVRDTVQEALDLSVILDTYREERGYPPYHPGMMVALLLYGYSRGLYSSRWPHPPARYRRRHNHRRRTTMWAVGSATERLRPPFYRQAQKRIVPVNEILRFPGEKMSDELSRDHDAIVERLLARLFDFPHGLGLDEAKARQIVEQVVIDMPLHTDEERLEWAWNWIRAASA